MRKFALLAMLLLCPALFSQQKQAEVPYLRVTSSLVLVDFVAVDARGLPVTDLRRDEVEIFEDRRKQSIESFYPPGQSSSHLSGQVSTGTPAAAAEPGAAPALGAARPSQTVIVVDSRAIDSNNLVHTVNAIREFIERHLAADHALMICEINRGLRVMTPMTRDRATLLAGLEQLKPQSVYNPLDATRASLANAEGYLDELQLQVLYVGEALKALCHSLAGPGGRKHVVFFSEGYPMDPKKLVEMNTRMHTGESRSADARQVAANIVGALKDPGVLPMVRDVVSAANGYGVSFYTIDARGLEAIPGISKATRGGNLAAGAGASVRPDVVEATLPTTVPPGFGSGPVGGDPEAVPTEIVTGMFQLVQIDRLDDALNTLTALAGGTNGLALYNTNDLGAILNYSALEQETFYLAGYVPSGKRKTGQFHTIEVRTSRPGVLIRSRKGYVDETQGQRRSARLSHALRHPEIFRQLEPMLSLEPSAGKIRTVMGVPADQIFFRRAGDTMEARVSFEAMIYDAGGKPVSKDFAFTKGFNLALTEEQFRGLGNQPLLTQDESKLKAGRYKLILLVEDHLAGTLGSAVEEFQVP